jgi:hypothetical protein
MITSDTGKNLIKACLSSTDENNDGLGFAVVDAMGVDLKDNLDDVNEDSLSFDPEKSEQNGQQKNNVCILENSTISLSSKKF